jgi:hypothetical protein
VIGNERADKEAKRAAKGESSHEYDIPIECRGVMPVSKAAELQRHHKKVKQEARTIFAKSPRARHAHEIDPSMPSAAFSKLTGDMPRRHASILVQLRTGHVGLNKHLHKIGKAESPLCPACQKTDETVHHFLFRCPAYDRQRRKIERELKRGAKSIKTMLGGHKTMKKLFRYIHDTRRFEKSHGALALTQKERNTERQYIIRREHAQHEEVTNYCPSNPRPHRHGPA